MYLGCGKFIRKKAELVEFEEAVAKNRVETEGAAAAATALLQLQILGKSQRRLLVNVGRTEQEPVWQIGNQNDTERFNGYSVQSSVLGRVKQNYQEVQ